VPSRAPARRQRPNRRSTACTTGSAVPVPRDGRRRLTPQCSEQPIGGDHRAGRDLHSITADITSNRRFHADTTYVLSGFIKVANGATLTIEPARRSSATSTYRARRCSCCAARIMAEGTAEADRVHLRATGWPAPAGRLGRRDHHRQWHHQPDRLNADRGHRHTGERKPCRSSITAARTTPTTAACCATSASSLRVIPLPRTRS
jgi:hypothetical protein